MNGSVVTIFAAVVILAFGLFSLYRVITRSKRIKDGAAWTAVAAQVVDKTVDIDRDSDGNTSYAPKVAYSYNVMGREYQGKVRMTGMWSRKSAQKAIDEIGNTIEVRYNPEKPEENTHGYEKVKFSEYLVIAAMLALAGYLLWTQLM